jgi:aminopeptidase
VRDPRIQTLAENLVNYSCELQPGEKVLIECTGVETDLVTALIEAAYQAGGLRFVKLNNAEVNRSLLMQAEAEQLALAAKYDAGLMQEMDAYIGFRSDKNSSELSDVPPEKQQLYQMHYSQPVRTD